MNPRSAFDYSIVRLFVLRPVFAGVTALCVAACADAQDAGVESLSTTQVAATQHFRFRSDLRMNLHDYLYLVARRDTSLGRNTVRRCEGTVPDDARERWLGAVQMYADSLAELGGFDRPMIDIRFVLSGLPGHGMEMPEWAAGALDDGEAVYRACVWEEQDERNRIWGDTVSVLVERFEPLVVSKLEELHQMQWVDERTPVDLVRYVSRQGANTVTDPDHIVVSTSDEDYASYGGLEMIFHEASHTFMGRRRGAIAEALNAQAEEQGVALPGDLWHVVLFYTAGTSVQNVLREELGVEYEQYLYATGLFDGAWPELRAPVEEHWTPYIEGGATLDEAARGLVAEFAR